MQWKCSYKELFRCHPFCSQSNIERECQSNKKASTTVPMAGLCLHAPHKTEKMSELMDMQAQVFVYLY